MKYYQLFYNATECGLSGKSGFGVRTATDGIPQEYIDAIEGDEFLHIYPNEDYGIKDAEIAMSPERIIEYPRTFYYRKLQITDGRELFLVGRIVYAFYDYSFYSGNSKRTGNLINHIYIFEEKPEADVFNMLFEDAIDGTAGFLPRDWTPRIDNPEMTKLMLGKPERLPVENKPFRSANPSICEKAYTLFFQHLACRNENKPIAVRAKASETGKIIAGFMRLLPDSIAKELTFVTNHQDNGLAKGVKITFLNEFYPYQIYTASCCYIDLIEGSIAPTALEKTYRKTLESLNSSENALERIALSEWICSDIALRNVSRPQEFNLALFNYVYRPDAFTYEDLDKNNGLIDELAKIIGKDANKSAHLNAVLSKAFSACDSAEDYKHVIETTERCRTVSIPVSPAIEEAKRGLTKKATTDIKYLLSCLSIIGENTFNRYTDKSAFPKLGITLPDIVKSDISVEDKKKLAFYLEPDSKQRVECYVAEIRKNPQDFESYRPLLEMDKFEADRIDWLKELKDSYGVNEIAGLLYEQLMRYPKGTAEQVNLYASLAAKNDTFNSLLTRNAGSIYSSICSSFEQRIKPCEFNETQILIEEKIRPFIKDDIGVSKRFDRLCRVMKADVDTVENPEEYWSLAVRINAEEAQEKLLPLCFSSFVEKETIFRFVETLLSRNILSKEEIIANVGKYTKYDRAKELFWRGLKKYGNYSGYDDIYNLGKMMNVSEAAITNVFETKYTSEYKTHKREVAKKRVLSTLKKKPVWISCSALLVIATLTALYLTVGQKILPESMRLPKTTPKDTSKTVVIDNSIINTKDSVKVEMADSVNIKK